MTSGWITNNPEAARRLKAIDAAYEQERANAAHLRLADKIVSYRCAKQRRDQAYDELLTPSRDIA